MPMKIVKVLIVDDSSLIRQVLQELLSTVPNIDVVGEAEDAFEARELIKKLNPDVITLDVEMPKMDGITFLSNLMRLRPMPVVMLSSLTTKGADVTLEALSIGAVDFIAKPSFGELENQQDDFRDLLVDKIVQASQVDPKIFKINSSLTTPKSNKKKQFLGAKSPQHIIAIGASTGGTEAIKRILTQLPANTPPIVIVQHIPKAFSKSFANRLNGVCEMNVYEAEHNQKILPGCVYISPGGIHLEVKKKSDAYYCSLSDIDRVNHHKPSVDVLFQSLLPQANNVQAVLLTGMGQDGAKMMLELKNKGAKTIIQNKKSSLIWGMPGKAFALNAYTKQCDIDEIAYTLLTYAGKHSEKMNEPK